jgi:ABC-type methionine transport system permease subunit
MAGFSSMDDMINKVTTLGQSFKNVWNKNFLPTSPAVAGEWHCLANGSGNPAAATIYNTGTNLVPQLLYDTTTTAGGVMHGGNVWPARKTILNASSYSAALTSVPGILMLVDMLAFHRVTTTTTTGAQAITPLYNATNNFTCGTNNILTHTFYNLDTGTDIQSTTTGTLPTGMSTTTDYYVIKLSDTTCSLATSYANAIAGTAMSITAGTGSGTHTLGCHLPRYTTGAGVQAFMFANNATPLGAATPNLSIAYNNSLDAGPKATPAVLPIGKTACPNGQILYSGTGAGKYGPFLPLAGGDAGIRNLTSVTISTSYLSGEFSVGLCKPLISLPMTTIGVASERDFVNQLPSMPQVQDGACLVWLYYSGLATPVNTGFYGHCDFSWG